MTETIQKFQEGKLTQFDYFFLKKSELSFMIYTGLEIFL